MIHWILPPKSQTIAKHVACYWFIEKHLGATTDHYPKLNPDPSAHLIISPENQPYCYDSVLDVAKGEGCHWLYPHQQTFQLDHRQPFVHLGIKFKIGALYSLDMASYSHPTLDTATKLNLTTLFDGNAHALIELARVEPQQCSDALDEILQPWILKSKQDQHTVITQKALRLLDSTTISALGSKLYCSQRTLERSFNRVTGLTLKQCQSMNKLEALLEYLYQRDARDIDWVEVAFKFGFSDQPHLIRHLKKQIGLTPQSYAKERGLTIDVYGGVQSC